MSLIKQNKSSYFPYTGSNQEHSPIVHNHLHNNKEVVGVVEAEEEEEVQVAEGVEEEVGVEALVVEGVRVEAMVETVIIHTNILYILQGYFYLTKLW